MHKPLALGAATLLFAGTVWAVTTHATTTPPSAFDDPMLQEVSVQCADYVTGKLDSIAEGTTDPALVPSPSWDTLIDQCKAEFTKGASYRSAQATVLWSYGYAVEGAGQP